MTLILSCVIAALVVFKNRKSQDAGFKALYASGKSVFNKHWVTTAFGLLCIVSGAWLCDVHWIAYQSFYFNMVYVDSPYLGLIAAGLIGVFAADGRHIP